MTASILYGFGCEDGFVVKFFRRGGVSVLCLMRQRLGRIIVPTSRFVRS